MVAPRSVHPFPLCNTKAAPHDCEAAELLDSSANIRQHKSHAKAACALGHSHGKLLHRATLLCMVPYTGTVVDIIAPSRAKVNRPQQKTRQKSGNLIKRLHFACKRGCA